MSDQQAPSDMSGGVSNGISSKSSGITYLSDSIDEGGKTPIGPRVESTKND